MKSIGDQFAELGLVSEDDAKKHDARQAQLKHTEEKKQQNTASRSSGKASSIDALEAADSVSKFRRVVLNLLLEHPEMITEVVEKAHLLKEASGGKKLVWQILQIRNKLPNTPASERARFLKRALRKAGGTFDQVTEN